jgi:hypothetical protein
MEEITLDLSEEDSVVFILTGGYTKESPDIPTVSVRQSLASQMRKYLLEKAPYLEIDSDPVAWGTLIETKEAICIMRQHVQSKFADRVVVHVSTNLGHLPRVLLCWFALRPKHWKIRWDLANHSFTPKEWGQETLKFLKYIPLLIRERKRARA